MSKQMFRHIFPIAILYQQQKIYANVTIWPVAMATKCLNKRAIMALDRSPELWLAMKMMASVQGEMPVKGFSCFISGGHFVKQNKTILEILLEGHARNISTKLFLK